MKEHSPTVTALTRAGKRVAFHMIQAGIEGLKAIEAIIEEIGAIADQSDQTEGDQDQRRRIEIE